MKAQFSLTSSESKRLIGKAISQHPDVKRAMKKGIVAIGLGSTNAYIIEEILKKKIEKERYIAGYIDEKGPCVIQAKDRKPEVVLKNGKPVKLKTTEVVKEMTATDVFIKGANALDFDGNAGVMLGSDTGGTVAEVLGVIKARGVNLIVPVGLEKLIPYSINDISNVSGIFEIDYSIGIPVGIMPVSGEVVTEIEALESLGVNAIAIGSGGIGEGETAKAFQIEGAKGEVQKVINMVRKLKGEKKVEALRGSCKSCIYKHCPQFRKR